MSRFYAFVQGGSSPLTPPCACLVHRFGNAADNGTRQRRYPTDMTDAQWTVVRPLLPGPGRPTSRRGSGLRLLPTLARTRSDRRVPRPAPRERPREKAGRDPEPTAGEIDSQPVKADTVVGADSLGFGGGKLINGRKRHAVVDTLGLLLGVMVTAANTSGPGRAALVTCWYQMRSMTVRP